MSASIRGLFKNLLTFLLAFMLAVAVWISAVVAADPNEDNTYKPVVLEIIGQAPNFITTGNLPTQVKISLTAPRSIWNHINNNPSLVKAWIDLTGLTDGQHTVKVQAQVNASPLRISQIEPAEVFVVLETLVTKTYPVQLNIHGDPSLGYSKDAPTCEPGNVIISGPASAVAKVSLVRASLDVAGVSQTVKTNVEVEVLDDQGNLVANITTNPRLVAVTQPISLLAGYRNVAVRVVTKGQVANGYRLTNISITPPTITVSSSNPRLVNELPGYIETMPVDITKLTDDVEINVALNLPKGITLVREPSVLVQIGVAAIEGSLTIPLPVEIMGLAPGLQVTLFPAEVNVVVSGPLNVLNTLSPASFRVVVNLTDLDVGDYQVTPVMDLAPDKVAIQVVLPETVQALIFMAPSPTPTLTPSITPTLTQTPTATRPIISTIPVRITPTPTRKN